MSDYILSFDVGGTRLKTGVVDTRGNLLASAAISSRANEGAEKLYETIRDFTKKNLSEMPGKMLGIGMALSGAIDSDKGVVLLPGKFKSLEGFPIIPMLRKDFEVPVYGENDGILAAYTERYFGEAKEIDWAVVLTIGTGIGSGVILDGRILHDPHLLFGSQLGHIIMDKSNDGICLTGNRGTGEMLCSATALVNQVRSALSRGLPSVLTDVYYSNPFDVDFQRIIEACRESDELCLAEMDTWTNNLSVLLINAVHCYGPQKIILSGGATLAKDLFLPELKEIVNKQIFRYPKGDQVEIVVSENQEYAGVLGAAAFVMKKLNILL